MARQLGRAEERTELHCLADLPLDMVDMLTLVLVGNSTSFTRGRLDGDARGIQGPGPNSRQECDLDRTGWVAAAVKSG